MATTKKKPTREAIEALCVLSKPNATKREIASAVSKLTAFFHAQHQREMASAISKLERRLTTLERMQAARGRIARLQERASRIGSAGKVSEIAMCERNTLRSLGRDAPMQRVATPGVPVVDIEKIGEGILKTISKAST